jgi:adenosylmethionine-8-amino-7-oxononanoate aminotransferase
VVVLMPPYQHHATAGDRMVTALREAVDEIA